MAKQFYNRSSGYHVPELRERHKEAVSEAINQPSNVEGVDIRRRHHHDVRDNAAEAGDI